MTLYFLLIFFCGLPYMNSEIYFSLIIQIMSQKFCFLGFWLACCITSFSTFHTRPCPLASCVAWLPSCPARTRWPWPAQDVLSTSGPREVTWQPLGASDPECLWPLKSSANSHVLWLSLGPEVRRASMWFMQQAAGSRHYKHWASDMRTFSFAVWSQALHYIS